jgi:hypothetical protein
MWQYVALYLASFVLSYLLAPKPKSQPPAGVGDITAPTAEAGREIPVLFGTRKLEGANVVWYGDLRTAAIKKKGGKK